MRRLVITFLSGILSTSSCLAAGGYSFDQYLNDRGGCSAQRQILDKRLKEIRFDFVEPGKADTGQGIDLFGQRAAEWTEQDIQAVIATFRRCEEHLFRTNLDPTGQPKNRGAMVKGYEVLIARGAARIEESLRDIILADRRNTARQAGASSEIERRGSEAGAPDRWNRAAGRQVKPESGKAGTENLAEGSGLTEAESARRADLRLALLQDARRVANDRETDRLRAEMPPSGRRPPQEAVDADRSGQTIAFAPRPIMDRQSCSITRDGFDQVQRSMPLERVEAVIGCRGTLMTTSMSAELGRIEHYSWDDRRTNGSITVQFLNSLVYTKSQVGLN